MKTKVRRKERKERMKDEESKQLGKYKVVNDEGKRREERKRDAEGMSRGEVRRNRREEREI